MCAPSQTILYMTVLIVFGHILIFRVVVDLITWALAHDETDPGEVPSIFGLLASQLVRVANCARLEQSRISSRLRFKCVNVACQSACPSFPKKLR